MCGQNYEIISVTAGDTSYHRASNGWIQYFNQNLWLIKAIVPHSRLSELRLRETSLYQFTNTREWMAAK